MSTNPYEVALRSAHRAVHESRSLMRATADQVSTAAQASAVAARCAESAAEYAEEAQTLANRWGGQFHPLAERAAHYAALAAKAADPEGAAAAEALELHEASLDAAIERNDP